MTIGAANAGYAYGAAYDLYARGAATTGAATALTIGEEYKWLIMREESTKFIEILRF